MGEAKQKLLDAEGKLAEERLQVVEDRRKLEEQKQKFQQEMEQKQKDEQNLILGKKLGSGHKGKLFKNILAPKFVSSLFSTPIFLFLQRSMACKPLNPLTTWVECILNIKKLEEK